MSLWGRYVIDRIKHAVSHRVTLPVPPYGNTNYWDKVYNTLGPQDVYEWGSVSFASNLSRHKYKLLYEYPESNNKNRNTMQETSFGDVLGIHPQDEENASICLLGCGNSKMGEEMGVEGWSGPLIQVDVSPRVLETMSQRCAPLIRDTGIEMDFVQDDATQLSAFDDNSMYAVIDKGLVDALFCANEFEQVQSVMTNVHRVLKPGSVFCVFSFSAPQYILPRMLAGMTNEENMMPSRKVGKDWRSVQVRELDNILMYRYEKQLNKPQQKRTRTRQQKQSRQTK